MIPSPRVARMNSPRKPIRPRDGTRNSSWVRPSLVFSMFCISALRIPNFSMQAPTDSSGTSSTRVSNGSWGVPSIVRKITWGWLTWNS